MKKSFLMILAAAALVSCSEKEVNPIDAGDVQIALRSTTVDASGVATRAPFEGAISATNKLEARVIAHLSPNYAGAVRADGTMTFIGANAVSYDAGASGTTTFDAANPVYLFGLYPATTWSYVSGGQADFVFTGKEDVMATNRVETYKTDVVNSTYKTLSFQHLLTKLELKLSAATAAINVFGKITAIKLVGDKTTGTTTIPNQMHVVNGGSTHVLPETPMVVTAVTNAETALNFYGLSVDGSSKKVYSESAFSDYMLTTTPEYVGYTMVAPVTASPTTGTEEYFLAITTEKLGVKYIGVDLMAAGGVTAFNGNTAGRSFSISVYFKSNDEIMTDVEVIDWIEEGESKGDIAQ